MAAELISLKGGPGDRDQIRRAATALKSGALVAFPTETVYGLAANASDPSAVERLRDVKGRTNTQPFTVHIGRRGDAADFVPDVTPVGQRLMRKGWPGPLTLIFPVADPRRAKAHPALCQPGAESIYSRGSVGLRYPDHPVAEQFLLDADAPIIASSANVTGRPAPLNADAVRGDLADRIDFILDAGPTRYQKGSTIIALNGTGFTLVRAGVWDERIVRQLATLQILFVCTGNTCRSPMAEGIFSHMIAQRLSCPPDELPARGIMVRSAGTGAFGGGRASPEAVEVCKRRGIDITEHRGRGLSLELIHPSDYIYTMGRQHLETVRMLAPSDASKATTLHPSEEIADPLGGSLEDYERAADKITEALKLRINEVPL